MLPIFQNVLHHASFDAKFEADNKELYSIIAVAFQKIPLFLKI